MHSKKGKLSLFLFIDALGWEIQQRHPEFLADLIQDSRPLETILGYSSACDPSIISGLVPHEHGLWSSFYYDPEGCPYQWVHHLRCLPEAVFRRGRIRRQISKWIKKRCGFSGYFQIYSVPFDALPLFNYAEQKSIWKPGGLPRGKSIFDRLEESGASYHVHDNSLSDALRFERLMSDIQNQRIDFAYTSIGQLDALMHATGNHHPDIGKLLLWYDRKIHALLEAAEENYEEVSWYVFSDHGMHNVTESHDLIADVEALGLVWNKDYVAFYDSTMARFWLLDEASRSPLIELLETHPKGRILSDAELKDNGVYFEGGQYGDLIFLMHSSIEIVPSFMGVKQVKGMHGYDPADADSYASISSNRSIPSPITQIQHIHQLMLNELGLD